MDPESQWRIKEAIEKQLAEIALPEDLREKAEALIREGASLENVELAKVEESVHTCNFIDDSSTGQDA